MKRLTIILAPLFVALSVLPASAGNDRIITVEELPAASQQFISTCFKEVEVSYAKVDEEWFDKEYKVVFVDGSKVEFVRSGAWKEIDCKYGEVPAGAVSAPIRDCVAARFPGRRIICIERDRRNCEVKLDNGLELEFDADFRLVDIDD